MTLSQSLDTLLELPELRAGVLCANYMKMIEGLLPDVIDYNIDLKNESNNNSVTHYVRGRMRIIAEFAKQELGSLNNLRERQIPCEFFFHMGNHSLLPLLVPLPSSGTDYFINRRYVVPPALSTAIATIP